ncbi:hypothetical protein BC835DRAFT_679350 [Cytidiella melzeri]|nr:hypothetical protein BC835DRAFT_679350 [Cytidiella melzeri]
MEVEPTHDTELWFSDGSIVLQAERTLFRVYAGILSQASPVFKHMLSIRKPQSTSEAEVYEGCPLVVMYGDSADDMHVFLQALHDSSLSFFDVHSLSLHDAHQIASILRLSTKYDVAHLRRRAVETLQKWYPNTLSSYISISSSSTPREDFPRHVLVANIASEANATILLPAALLFCCATASSRLLYDGIYVSGVHYDLRSENKRALFIGRPLLTHQARTNTQSFLFRHYSQEHSNCKTPSRCEEFCEFCASIYDIKGDPWMNPLERLNWKAILSACCQPCVLNWESKNKKGTEELWETLPSLFDLPEWTVLEQRFRDSVGPELATGLLAVTSASTLTA